MIFLFGTNAVSDLMRKHSKVEAPHSQPTIESSCVRSFAVKIRSGTLSATGSFVTQTFSKSQAIVSRRVQFNLSLLMENIA
jgi:hypothetical protein